MKLLTDTLREREPGELAELIRSNMDWGPMNSEAADRANFCCEYCGDCLLDSVVLYYSWEIDHIVPGAGDDLENIALACRTCNHLKHTYPPEGGTREDRLKDAKRKVMERREIKKLELDKLRGVISQYYGNRV